MVLVVWSSVKKKTMLGGCWANETLPTSIMQQRATRRDLMGSINQRRGEVWRGGNRHRGRLDLTTPLKDSKKRFRWGSFPKILRFTSHLVIREIIEINVFLRFSPNRCGLRFIRLPSRVDRYWINHLWPNGHYAPCSDGRKTKFNWVHWWNATLFELPDNDDVSFMQALNLLFHLTCAEPRFDLLSS